MRLSICSSRRFVAAGTIMATLALLGFSGPAVAADPAPAPVQPWHARPEVGVNVGYMMFAEVSGLGNSFFKDDVADNAPVLGLRLAYPFTENIAAEIDLGYSAVTFRADGTSGAAAGGDASVLNVFAQARYSFMTQQKISPFVALGVGEMFQFTDKDYVKDVDYDLTYALSAGIQARLGFRLRGRIDVRYLASEGRPEKKDEKTGEVVEAATSVSNHLQVLVGLTYLIGGPEEDSDMDGLPDDKDKCPQKAEDKDGFQDEDGCPELDNDNDGIPDTSDKCPTEAEDKDGFEDADGCPEADNDRDGLPDAGDKCPNKAEDKDGFQDGDGCPDLDNDRDGVPDANDRCPNKPEDKDGFQDSDGCPEPDNDRDGVPDAKDKCPNKPETVNGLSDEDGCPDALPDHVARLFDGPLYNINFGRKGKLKRKSANTLEKLLELMLENEKVKIEIHVHVDGKGKASKHKAESLKRASAIRKFYEDAGIDAARFILFGHGNTKPIAKGKGRKVWKQNTRVELKIHRATK